MFRALRTSLALGIATVAITAASVVPAFASNTPPTHSPNQTPAPPQPRPDVTVWDAGMENYSNTVTHFKWMVMNIGDKTSGTIHVDATCDGELINGKQEVYQHARSGLDPRDYLFVTYDCAGGVSHHVGSTIHVWTAYDSNTYNDLSRVQNYYKP